MKKRVFVLFMFFCSLVVSAQNDSVINVFSIAETSLGKDINYLKAITRLKEVEGQCMTDMFNRGMYLQAALTYNAFLLNNPESYELQKSMFQIKEGDVSEYSNGLKIDDVINQMSDKITNRQVVMINEIHWLSRARYLTNILLPMFYEKGFRYLAMEAVFEDADTLIRRGYPDLNTGIYTLDPRMSNLIRDALRMGFRIVHYDYYGEKDREYMQASNIYDRTLKMDKDAKVLVYSGGSHSNKCPSRKLMAYHFKEISGMEPYVIWQVKHQEGIKGYHGITVEESSDTCSYDIGIINGLQDADFLFRPDMDQKGIIPADYMDDQILTMVKETPCFFSVYLQGEFANSGLKAVPVASYLTNNDFLLSPVMLPSDHYIFTIRNLEGDIVFEKDVVVL